MSKESVIVPEYEEGGVDIEMRDRGGKVRFCSDSYYGEYDCTFCDAHNWGEGDTISVGDSCRRCQAVVVSVGDVTPLPIITNHTQYNPYS